MNNNSEEFASRVNSFTVSYTNLILRLNRKYRPEPMPTMQSFHSGRNPPFFNNPYNIFDPEKGLREVENPARATNILNTIFS